METSEGMSALPQIAQPEDLEEEPGGFERAAFLRLHEGWSWERIAREIGCGRRTLYNWRKRPEWEQAKAVIRQHFIKADASDIAWGSLVRNALRGDTAACKEILLRTDGAVPNRIALGQDPNAGPAAVVLMTPEQIALMEAREFGKHGSGNGTAPAPE